MQMKDTYIISKSALDREWFDVVPKHKPVFITAQGLFMYLKEEDIRSLVLDITNTFQNDFLMFDIIPVWLSKITMSYFGLKKTRNYTLPKMP